MASSNISSASRQVGFIGLGNMGKFMAINLANGIASQQGGRKLKVWNRTASKTDEVVRESNGNAEAVQDVAQLAAQSDIIFTSLSKDAVVKDIFAQLLSATPKNAQKLFVETSTVFPDFTDELEKEVLAHGSRFVSAPTFGQPPVAKTAGLLFAVAGQEEDVKLATEYLVPFMGRKTMEFGSKPSKASTFKLIGNSIILATVEMMSESMTLAEKTGIGADRVLEFVQTLYPAPPAINYATKVANLKFEANGGFDLQGGLKDAYHISNLGKQNNCPMHIVDQAIKHLNTTIKENEGQGNKDWAALVAGQRIESGLKPFEQ